MHHFYSVRYVIGALPAYLLLGGNRPIPSFAPALAARLQRGEPRAKMVRDLVNGDLDLGRWALGARR